MEERNTSRNRNLIYSFSFSPSSSFWFLSAVLFRGREGRRGRNQSIPVSRAGALIKDRRHARCRIRSQTLSRLEMMSPAMLTMASGLLNAITMKTKVMTALSAPTVNASHEP
jgi:hypothetical protein